MMEVNNNQRIFWVDWAKSICMFLVVLGHCHIRESEQFVTQYIYSFHILLFFFLSGLLCKRHLNKESVVKDIRFLILPYFTYGLFLIAFNMLCSQMFDAEIIWHKIKALSIGLDAGIGPIWFLLALFICKQLFMIISLVKKYNMYLYYLIVFLSLFPIFFISSFHINLPFFSDSALCGLPFFIIGNESKSLMRDLKHINKFWQLVLAVLLGLVSIVLCKMIIWFNRNIRFAWLFPDFFKLLCSVVSRILFINIFCTYSSSLFNNCLYRLLYDHYTCG